MENNEVIRNKIRSARIPQYLVAHELGISEITLCRWLRFPLDEEKVRKVNAAIESIVTEREKE